MDRKCKNNEGKTYLDLLPKGIRKTMFVHENCTHDAILLKLNCLFLLTYDSGFSM